MGFRKYTYYAASAGRLLAQVRPLPTVLQYFFPGIAHPGQAVIELPGRQVQFKVRGAMDIWSVKETFLDRFYVKFGFPLQDGWTVVDIGGGIGEFTVFAARGYPHSKVYAFEPTPESFALLQENLSRNHLPNAQAYAEAIWSHEGFLSLDTSPGAPAQFSSHRPASQPGGATVPSLPLGTAFERLGVDCCDLLKVDCEGAEYAILFNTPDRILDRIQRIVMEYHDGVTNYSHTDLARFLRERGFQVETFPNWVHPDLGYLRASR